MILIFNIFYYSLHSRIISMENNITRLCIIL